MAGVGVVRIAARSHSHGEQFHQWTSGSVFDDWGRGIYPLRAKQETCDSRLILGVIAAQTAGTTPRYPGAHLTWQLENLCWLLRFCFGDPWHVRLAGRDGWHGCHGEHVGEVCTGHCLLSAGTYDELAYSRGAR